MATNPTTVASTSQEESRPATRFADFPSVSHIDQPSKPPRPTPLLTPEQTESRMAQLLGPSGWQLETEGTAPEITKTFRLKKYKECLQFVVDIADLARREHHHPDVTLKMGVVSVTTHTHCAFDSLSGSNENKPGLSDFDVRLALQIDAVYEAYTKSNVSK